MNLTRSRRRLAGGVRLYPPKGMLLSLLPVTPNISNTRELMTSYLPHNTTVDNENTTQMDVKPVNLTPWQQHTPVTWPDVNKADSLRRYGATYQLLHYHASAIYQVKWHDSRGQEK